MAKKSKWSRDVLGKSRYFRRDTQGSLYFHGQKTWYQINHSKAQHILFWLFIYQLLAIASFALIFLFLILYNKFLWVILLLFVDFLCGFFVHWHFLNWLSTDLTPLEDLPSTAWKQYWANEILWIDGLWLTCCFITLCACTAVGLDAALHGYLLVGILFFIFFVAVSIVLVYRLIKIIHFKKNQSEGGT